MRCYICDASSISGSTASFNLVHTKKGLEYECSDCSASVDDALADFIGEGDDLELSPFLASPDVEIPEEGTPDGQGGGDLYP